ncbi:MAG: glycogen synthase [Deltaproteobacteria bacterium]|nr:glycogen synthase [Deltaproteobacteria bacterium]
MNVLVVTSEAAPFAKTGGLGDVLGALPRYLRKLGHDVRVFLPFYSSIDTKKGTFSPVGDPFPIVLGPHRYVVRIVTVDTHPGTFFVHCPELYARGSLYTNDLDEHRRFLVLGWAALIAAQHMRFAPDVLHCNDWQCGLLPLTLKVAFGWDRLFANTKTLLSIHNLNYQGVFPASTIGDTNLASSAHLFHQDQLHHPHGGRINYMLHGLLYAGIVSTVSPTYAREIQSEEHGAGLDPFLRARRSTVVGILNGVDYDEWSPEKDTLIPHRYSAADLSGKALDKEALVTALGLPYVPGVPVLGIVSRMASQKGFDLLGPILGNLLVKWGFQLAVLGSGESRLEQMFEGFRRRFPKQVGFYRGFSNPLAHLIEAGSDIFLMPSRYEPCGLNQMYSLRYGTVPIVHRTGGLADTVRPWNPYAANDAMDPRRAGNGFVFDHHDSRGLEWAIEMALGTFKHRPSWDRLVQNGMAEDFSWERQAALYVDLYQRIPG